MTVHWRRTSPVETRVIDTSPGKPGSKEFTRDTRTAMDVVTLLDYRIRLSRSELQLKPSSGWDWVSFCTCWFLRIQVNSRTIKVLRSQRKVPRSHRARSWTHCRPLTIQPRDIHLPKREYTHPFPTGRGTKCGLGLDTPKFVQGRLYRWIQNTSILIDWLFEPPNIYNWRVRFGREFSEQLNSCHYKSRESKCSEDDELIGDWW